MVEQYYDESRAVGQKPQPVAFQSDSITLDIDDEGVRVKGGWSIQPMMHPAVCCSHLYCYYNSYYILLCKMDSSHSDSVLTSFRHEYDQYI